MASTSSLTLNETATAPMLLPRSDIRDPEHVDEDPSAIAATLRTIQPAHTNRTRANDQVRRGCTTDVAGQASTPRAVNAGHAAGQEPQQHNIGNRDDGHHAEPRENPPAGKFDVGQATVKAEAEATTT
jgi:hypothetical protein